MHYLQINVEIKEGLAEPVVTIQCGKKDHFIEQLIAALRIMDRQLTVSFHGAATTLALSEILYIESVDRKCFVYTKNNVFETTKRLYELEQQLVSFLFLRINKSCIVNLKNIDAIRAYLDRRLLITMSNGEQLIVSRQYAPELKHLLGVK